MADRPTKRVRLRLERVKGDGPDSFDLPPDGSAITIGRSKTKNQLVLGDARGTVSRQHAQIELEGGAYRIRDLESSNGTFVQEVKVEKGESRLLGDNDEIRLGLAVLRVKLMTEEPRDSDGTIVDDVAPPRPWPVPPPAPTTAQPNPPPPPPVKPSPSLKLPVIGRRGSFEIHRELHMSDRLSLELATDTRQQALVLVRRWRGIDLGFFARMRFRKAFKKISEFRHERVLTPSEMGAGDGDTWVIYPGFDDVTAGKIVRAAGRDLRIDVGIHVARETCRAVEALARAGFAGPPVTDQDVLVGRDGRVVLLAVVDPDGLVRDDRYTAPEEDAGEARDARSVVFSIGVLLYELLVRQPISGSEKLTLPRVDFRRVQVGPELADAVMRALEIEPHARFADAVELGRALGQALEQVAPDFQAEQVGAWVASRFAQ